MVKATVRAMDVLQAASQQYGLSAVNQFVVAGHSKRGHTAWLTAAVDSRVAGLIAQGFNTLNSSAQIAHYFATYGALDQSALAAKQVIEQINTPNGQRLLRIVDAYTYRQQLTMPKLVIVGTNDDYTPVDALNLYWPVLASPKSVLALTNTGHVGANQDARLFPTAYAFIKAIAQKKPMPIVESNLQQVNKRLQLVITTDKSATSARIWTAHSSTRDFRASQWVETQLTPVANPTSVNTKRRYEIALDKPMSGYNAIIGEVEFTEPTSRFLLSTVPYVVEGQ
jgi:PhoPQ-activated pathogenicity-related protein